MITIENVANKVAKRNHFNNNCNDKLQVTNKVAKRNNNNKERNNRHRAMREVTTIRQEKLVVVPVADVNNRQRRSTRRGTIC